MKGSGCTINNASKQDMGALEGVITRFYPYAKGKLGFKDDISVNLVSDPQNSKDPFGKTAYYDPNKMEITIFVDKRHVKDMLRSFSHELVHHAQNCRGDFEHSMNLKPGYAQKDPHMRRMEAEAYLLGNGFLVRDYEDQMKHGQLKENKQMSITKEQAMQIAEKLVEEMLPEKFAAYKRDKEPALEENDGAPAYDTSAQQTTPAQNAAMARTKADQAPFDPQVAMGAANTQNVTRSEARLLRGYVYNSIQMGRDKLGDLINPSGGFNTIFGQTRHSTRIAGDDGDEKKYTKSIGGVPRLFRSADEALAALRDIAKKLGYNNNTKLIDIMKNIKTMKIPFREEVNKEEVVEEADKMPMDDEPEGKDLNKDGKKGHGKVPAFLVDDSDSDSKKDDGDKKDDDKEEKSDKDLSKVPPQLRKHVAKNQKKGNVNEEIDHRNNLLFEKLTKKWTK